VIGDADGGTAQPATFLVDAHGATTGQYKYVSGSGVDDAVAEGTIRLGYSQPTLRRAPQRVAANDPEFYVPVGANKWVGFSSRAAAERYAATTGSAVKTRDDVLGGDAK
jgi:hypothetical protein